MKKKYQLRFPSSGLRFELYNRCTRKPASRVFLAPPEGLMQFLPSFNHAWQLLLAKFFDLVKLKFWPLGPPEPPGGQGSNLNSLFPALQHEGHTLSIWFGYYERFPRSFATHVFTDKAKSTSKYLLDSVSVTFGTISHSSISVDGQLAKGKGHSMSIFI